MTKDETHPLRLDARPLPLALAGVEALLALPESPSTLTADLKLLDGVDADAGVETRPLLSLLRLPEASALGVWLTLPLIASLSSAIELRSAETTTGGEGGISLLGLTVEDSARGCGSGESMSMLSGDQALGSILESDCICSMLMRVWIGIFVWYDKMLI